MATEATTVPSAFITFVPPLDDVNHPLNVYPVFVAVGIEPVVVLILPVYTAFNPYGTYNGVVPLIVPPLVVASKSILAFTNVISA